MMKNILKSVTVLMLVASLSQLLTAQHLKIDVEKLPFTLEETDGIIAGIESQYQSMIDTNSVVTLYPRSTNSDGSLRLVESWDWTSGFFPGSLWMLYEYTKDETWKNYASQWTAGIENQKTNTGTHDLGFMLGNSFGNGYRLIPNEEYKDILLTAANSLISRYSGEVGCIRSWDFGPWEFPVIIDNMMNLELLFLATKLSGDNKYYDIAVDHALTTKKNHIKEDNSTWHVVDYDEDFGDIILGKYTHQGYADSSSWARGQAWGIYGFTTCYRETGDPRFLETAEDLANFVINHERLPEDLVPYWDYDDPAIPNTPRDASAAAITCSALLELCKYSDEYADTFLNFALTLLNNLTSTDYKAESGTNNNFILMHSTGNKPGGSEIDVPINYADYYYLEALLRYRGLINTPPSVTLETTIKNSEETLDVFFDASQTTDPENDSVVSFVWDFGDGQVDTTSADTILHTYEISGNYNVSVTAIDYWGTSSVASKSIDLELGIFKLKPGLEGKHPRILFTQEEARARALLAETYMKDEYDSFLQECRNIGYPTNAGILGQQQWWYFSRLAIGIGLSEEQSLIDKGGQWLAKIIEEDWNFDAGSSIDLDMAHKLAGFALLYDCMYNYLNDSEKKEYEYILKQGLIKFRTHGYDLNDYWTNDYQNNHMHFRATASLYCAAILIDKKPEIQSEADYIIDVWRRIAYMSPHDGSNHEGLNYSNYGGQMLFPGVYGLKHTTGIDMTNDEHYHNVGYYYLYHVVPGMSSGFGFGDAANSAAASGPNYLFQIANNANDPYIQNLATNLREKYSDAFFLRQWYILFNDPFLEQKDFSDLPLYRYFDDIGIAVCRSNWTDDATAVAFKCGPLGGKLINETRGTEYSHFTDYVNVAHDDPDQGTFLLFSKGEFLTTGDGYEKENKITTQHSTFVVDGLSQYGGGSGWSQPKDTSNYAYPKDFFAVNNNVVFSGDMKGVYPNMDLLNRTFVSHKAKYIVIYDDARSETADRNFDWRLQTKGSLTDQGAKTYKVTNGESSALAKILSPAEADWSTTTNKIGNILRSELSGQQNNRYMVLIWPNASNLNAIEENIDTESAIGVKVNVDSKFEYTLFQKEDNETATSGNIKFNGNTLIVNEDNTDNSLQAASLVNGDTLEINLALYFTSNQRINFGIASISDDEVIYVLSPSTSTLNKENIGIQLGGLTPGTTYYLFKNEATTGTELTTDADGICYFETDITEEFRLIATKKNVNLTSLEKTIDEAREIYDNAVAGTNPGEYKSSSKSAFLVAIENAENIADTATHQNTVDDALSDLTEAKNTFERSVIKDLSVLLNLIDECNLLHNSAVEGTEAGQYEPGAKSIFKEAIISAEEILADTTVLQLEINGGIEELMLAQAEFQSSYIPVPAVTKFSDIEYFGDFENYMPFDKTLWEIKKEDDDNYTIGMKTFSYTSGQFILVKDTTFQNFELSFQAKAVSGSYGNDIMIVFGYQNSSNYSYIKLSDTENESGVFTRINGPTKYTWNLEDDQTIGVDGFDWNEYKMTSVDSVITLYRNENVLFTIENDSNLYYEGNIGIGTFYRNQAYFDDINIKVAVDYSPLQSATDSAVSLITNAVEGTQPGEYTVGSKAIFQEAIDSAQNVLGNDSYTQDVVDATYRQLLDAIEEFNNQIITSIKNDYLKDILLYPNPANSILYIEIPKELKIEELSIISITGEKLIYKENLDEHKINITDLSPGSYILRLETNQGTSQRKLMIHK